MLVRKGSRLKGRTLLLFARFSASCIIDVPSCPNFKFLGCVWLGRVVRGPSCSTSMSIELEVVGVC